MRINLPLIIIEKTFMKIYEFEQIQKIIDKSKNILLTTHIRPDGDALGSESALFHLLKKLGKNPTVFNSSSLPQEYEFLNIGNFYNQYHSNEHFKKLKGFDLVIVLDVSAYSRLGKIGEDLQKWSIQTICFDHHPTRTDKFDYEIIDSTAAATGSLVYEYIQNTNPELMDLNMANALYICILTDTGSFRFENTSSKTMGIAAELIDYGVKPGTLYQNIYENRLPEQMLLLGLILQRVKYTCNGKLAWFCVTRNIAKQAGVKLEDVDGYTDFIRSTKGVEIAIMFLEQDDDKIRLNFRSKGNIVINQVAKKYNGGGHAFAAGASINCKIEEAVDEVVNDVKILISDYENNNC